MTDRYENIRKALTSFDACGSHYWRDELARECDPDTIRELLAERDAATAIVAELCSTREGAAMVAGLVSRKLDHVGSVIDAAIVAANGGGNG